MSSANRASFIPSFSVCPPLTSFPCLIALARMPSAMVNKRAEGGCLCLVRKGKASHEFHKANR